MGIDHPDSVTGTKASERTDGTDGKPTNTPDNGGHSLGGELLVSPAAGKMPALAKEAPGLQPITIVDHPPTDLERQQTAYDQQHGLYEKDLKGYWDGVSAAKKDERFVMDFPPIYSGPAKPHVPGQPPEVKPNSVPTIRNMLDDSKHLNQFATGDKDQPEFNLRQVGEAEFKQRYAQEAIHIGQEHNLDKNSVRDIVRSIYAFEDGGWGTHETLSSMPKALVADDRPAGTTDQTARLDFHLNGPQASSALGYNQLLTATTMDKIQHQSQPIADRLNQLAGENPDQATTLKQKALLVTALGGALDREVLAMANADKTKQPEDQSAYLDKDGKPTELLYRDFLKSSQPTAAGITRQDMARAVQALNLDGDIGPIIQAQELDGLFKAADKYGYQSLLQGLEQSDRQAVAAYDALPAVQKEQAVHDILDRIKPPATGSTAAVATAASDQDFNATREALEQKLLALQPGVDNSLSKDTLSTAQSDMLRTGVLTLKDMGETSGALSPQSQLLLKKVAQSYYNGLTADQLMPAALELANLAGPQKAQQMIDAHNQDVPTTNFFSQAGYYANPVTNGRSGAELLLQIERIMTGPSYSQANRPAQAAFNQAFDAAAPH